MVFHALPRKYWWMLNQSWMEGTLSSQNALHRPSMLWTPLQEPARVPRRPRREGFWYPQRHQMRWLFELQVQVPQVPQERDHNDTGYHRLGVLRRQRVFENGRVAWKCIPLQHSSCIQMYSEYSYHSHSTLSNSFNAKGYALFFCGEAPMACAISAFESRSKPFQIHNSRSGALTARPFRGVTGVTGGKFRSGELLQRPQARLPTPQILGNAGKSIKTYKDYKVERGFHLTKFPVVAGGYCWFMLISYPKL